LSAVHGGDLQRRFLLRTINGWLDQYKGTMPWWCRDRQSSMSDLVERGSYSTLLGFGEHFVEQLARSKCTWVRVAVGGTRELQRQAQQ
jgi:hypothetical protein